MKQLTLCREESRHLCVVRRIRVGDRVDAFDGSGRVFKCFLAAANPKSATLEVNEIEARQPWQPLITVVPALPKTAAFEQMLHQCVELGVASIAPLLSERVESKVDNERVERKIERWRSLLVEALKQSGNPWMPELLPPQKLELALENQALKAPPLKLLGSLESDAVPLKHWLQEMDEPSLVLVIGPEGDFSPLEYEKLRHAGYKPCSLGPHVLRTHTALAVFVSQVRALLG